MKVSWDDYSQYMENNPNVYSQYMENNPNVPFQTTNQKAMHSQ